MGEELVRIWDRIPELVRSSLLESLLLLCFTSPDRVRARGGQICKSEAPRRSVWHRFSKSSYSHGPSRLGAQKHSKNNYKQASHKLRFESESFQKRCVFEHACFLLFKFAIFESVKMWLFHYSQLNFNGTLPVQTRHRKHENRAESNEITAFSLVARSTPSTRET